ncbi:MAG TPA: hypothetical protein VF768_10555 [Holophagaceae bacterium]
MPKPNYQRDKRQRDLARQRKQEEKRQKKALKGQGEPDASRPGDAPEHDPAELPASAPGGGSEALGSVE